MLAKRLKNVDHPLQIYCKRQKTSSVTRTFKQTAIALKALALKYFTPYSFTHRKILVVIMLILVCN